MTPRPRPAAPPRRAKAGIRVRRARVTDAPAVARVMAAAIRGLAAPHHPARAVAAWASLPPLYHAWAMTAGGERYLVAERAGRIVAYAARRGPEITALFVSPGAARRGLGAALVRRIEADAGRAGLRALFVRAAASAAPFYAALGYRPGRRLRVPLPGGERLDAVHARKHLDRR